MFRSSSPLKKSTDPTYLSQIFNGKNGVYSIEIQGDTIKMACETQNSCDTVFEDLKTSDVLDYDHALQVSKNQKIVQLNIPSSVNKAEIVDFLFDYFERVVDYQLLRSQLTHKNCYSPSSSEDGYDHPSDNPARGLQNTF